MSPLKRASRGQSLVLLSLTLFLLSLMVVLTLEVAQRVKDRTEAQVVADASAYSEAVVIARAFNGAAILNRARFAMIVSMLTTESMISYAGALRGMSLTGLNGKLLRAGCPPVPSPAPPGGWAILDENAGKQVLADQGAAHGFKDKGNDLIFSLVCASGTCGGKGMLLSGSPDYIPRRIAELAYPKAFGDTSHALAAVSLPEDTNYASCTTARAHYHVNGKCHPRDLPGWPGIWDQYTDDNQDGRAALYAVMGTRETRFITNRNPAFAAGSAVPGVTVSGGGTTGGGSGFGSPDMAMEAGGLPKAGNNMASENAQRRCDVSGPGVGGCVNGTVLWAEDDGGKVTVSAICRGRVISDTTNIPPAFVGSNALQYPNDEHSYAGSTETDTGYHTLGFSQPPPGVFGGAIGYDADNVQDQHQLFAQPVTMPVLKRDYSDRVQSKKSDPWNLNFKFDKVRFHSAGDTQDADANTTPVLKRQVTLSTGVAYYHRNTHMGGGRDTNIRFEEPPNLFNPFWRATLVTGHIYEDAAKGTGQSTYGSVEEVLKGAGFDEEADVAKKLYAEGFRGY